MTLRLMGANPCLTLYDEGRASAYASIGRWTGRCVAPDTPWCSGCLGGPGSLAPTSCSGRGSAPSSTATSGASVTASHGPSRSSPWPRYVSISISTPACSQRPTMSRWRSLGRSSVSSPAGTTTTLAGSPTFSPPYGSRAGKARSPSVATVCRAASGWPRRSRCRVRSLPKPRCGAQLTTRGVRSLAVRSEMC